MTEICQIFVKMAEYSVSNEYSARKRIFVRTQTFGRFLNKNIRLRTKDKFPFRLPAASSTFPTPRVKCQVP